MLIEYTPLLLTIAATLIAAAPAASSLESLLSTRSPRGLGTVYSQHDTVGSCGKRHSDSAMIVALSNSFMQSQSPAPYCDYVIQATNIGSDDEDVQGLGNTITVIVADTCPGCVRNHIDLSIGAWNALTDNSPQGRVTLDWQFLDE